MHYTGGQLVAVGSRDRTVSLLDIASLKEISPVIQGHAGSIRAVLVCQEKDLVISASYDLSIRSDVSEANRWRSERSRKIDIYF